jgi:acyl dehydratase
MTGHTEHEHTEHEGPYFDDLRVGDVFDTAPARTLTSGLAAVHQSIIGGRLRLPLDEQLSRAVTGGELADPALVWDTAIGQSTQVTRRVIANLFYRGLVFRRLPAIGDTLRTRTEVVGLRQNASRPTGMAALRMTTTDQQGRLVLDFWRCAMLPLSSPDVRTGHADDLSAIGEQITLSPLLQAIDSWDLSPFPRGRSVEPATTWTLGAGDLVSSAPELARATLNLAHVHHDRFAGSGERLVYGGHTIGLALAQLTRVLPDLLTVAGWHSCDHTGPVREGDTLVSTVTLEDAAPATEHLRALTLRVQVSARRDGCAPDPVLDWKLVALSR